MKELYTKIMASEDLQKQVMEILAATEEEDEEATQKALVAFAKEQGYEVTFDEIQKFMEEMQKSGELSEDELDMVAGGKADTRSVIGSVISLGVGCAIVSALAEIDKNEKKCKDMFIE